MSGEGPKIGGELRRAFEEGERKMSTCHAVCCLCHEEISGTQSGAATQHAVESGDVMYRMGGGGLLHRACYEKAPYGSLPSVAAYREARAEERVAPRSRETPRGVTEAQLVEERDQWKARAEAAERLVAGHSAVSDSLLKRAEQAERERDDAQRALSGARGAVDHNARLSVDAQQERDKSRTRLAEVEAQCAVMREALEAADFWVNPGTTRGPASDHWVRDMAKIQAALAPDAGRALLERVKVLEEVAEAARAMVDVMSYAEGSLAEAVDTALAKFDALKAGGR